MPKQAVQTASPVETDLIQNDTRAALLGAFLSNFSGHYVSDPISTIRADNKLLQLQVAASVGLNTPATLVSNDPTEVQDFISNFERVVVKPVKGTLMAPLLTQFVTDLNPPEDAVVAAPAIYQEFIAGSKHLRVHIFGNAILAASIESQELDWRRDLTVPILPHVMDALIAGQLKRLLEELGLRMGVADLKLLPSGEIVFLEMNPQGQFLFIEGICGLPLTESMADLLVQSAVGK